MLATLQAKLIAFGGACLLGVLLTSGAAYKIHAWRVASLRAEWADEKEKALTDAKEAVQKVCDDNNRITKESARALQTKLDSTAGRYYRLLQHNASGARAAAPPGAAGGGDGAPGAAVPVVQVPIVDGLAAGRASDEQAARLITLQDIVAEIYKANGQADLLPVEYLTKEN